MAETDSDRFAGKVAFVTGAGGGIGRATAELFADNRPVPLTDNGKPVKEAFSS